MQLISLTANKETFCPVRFNKTGLSFIVAKQKNPISSESNDDGKTYNGVGKTLLVRIINFCLGAKPDSYKDFCTKLPGWEFRLEFKINVMNFVSVRKTDYAKKIFLNDEELSLNKFNEKLQELCFSIPEDADYLSFRSLLPFFLRPQKESYTDCMKPGKTGSDYQALLYNAFLIGLDIKLAEQKFRLRKEQEKIQKVEQIFKDDSALYDFMSGNRDIKLELENIDDRIKQIEINLREFKIAEDYHEIQSEADKIETILFSLNNEITLIQNNIEAIDRSLAIKNISNMTNNELERIYNEANIVFPESVKKTLGEIENFYKNLIQNRKKRLSEQKNQLIFNKKDKESEKNILQKKLDVLIGYLGEHQALDVYIALNKQLSDLNEEKAKLSRFSNMQIEYKEKERQINKDFIELEKITDDYLKSIEDITRQIRDFFRDLAKKFYPQSPSGITINIHGGKNQLAFDIAARIDSDASDGISNVKLFCYDLSILLKGKNHTMDFIFHDSRLFDGVDERQVAVIFQILQLYFSDSKKQYIATINQNQLNGIKNILSESEFQDIIENNTILILTDETDSEKLLGIKVDIGNK